MAQAPDSLGFRFAVVLALAVIIVAITTWAANHSAERSDLPGSTFEFVLNGRQSARSASRNSVA